MKCQQCKSESPEGKKFCGDCGVRLEPLSDDQLRARIRAVLKEEIGDQRIVEVELTESILERLTKWAKTLGFFAGIPIAILLLVLGILGLKKYSDLWALSSAAEGKVRTLEQQASDVENEYKTLLPNLEDIDKRRAAMEDRYKILAPKLDSLDKDVDRYAQLDKSVNVRFASLQTSLDKRINSVEGQVNEIRQTIAPGKARWLIKTAADEEVGRVASTQVMTTIEELASLTPPPKAELQSHRVAPAEFKMYTVDATIVDGILELDGDYELTLKSDGGTMMRAEAPNPDPTFVATTSRWAKEIATVRKQLDDKLHPQARHTKYTIRARITGIGFFDRPHGQTGGATNGFELHPIIRVEFLE